MDLNTHALILRGSYTQLSRDSLFRAVNFPALNGILAREGVRWKPSASSLPFSVKSLLDAEGPGPDVEGASKYSQHWYNPRTGKGGTPDTVGGFFSKLVRGILAGDTRESNWGASWSAHFLADMNAPHHVVGIPAGDAEYRNTWGAPAGGTAWKLSEEEAGPLWLVKVGGNVLSPEWGEAYDFKRAIEVFVDARRESGKILEFRDWFDPWYWNGSGGGIDPLQLYGPFTLNSSHVSWEKWAHGQVRGRDFTSQEMRYHPEWHNGWLSFDEKPPWAAQVLQAVAFTKAAANNTRENLEERFVNPGDGVSDAVWRVATLWRAAVSALAPHLSWKPDPSRPEIVEVKGVVENRAPTGAYDVKVRLAILMGNEPRYLNVKEIGSIAAPKEGERSVGSAFWQVPADDVRNRRVRLEVIGHFDDNQPDLQYAMLEQEARDIPTSLAALDCNRLYPGSVAVWSELKQRAGCVCPDPPGWNADKTACNDPAAKVVEALDCDSKYPGSIAVWDKGKQMEVCRCVPPKKWNATQTACITASVKTTQDPITPPVIPWVLVPPKPEPPRRNPDSPSPPFPSQPRATLEPVRRTVSGGLDQAEVRKRVDGRRAEGKSVQFQSGTVTLEINPGGIGRVSANLTFEGQFRIPATAPPDIRKFTFVLYPGQCDRDGSSCTGKGTGKVDHTYKNDRRSFPAGEIEWRASRQPDGSYTFWVPNGVAPLWSEIIYRLR